MYVSSDPFTYLNEGTVLGTGYKLTGVYRIL